MQTNTILALAALWGAAVAAAFTVLHSIAVILGPMTGTAGSLRASVGLYAAWWIATPACAAAAAWFASRWGSVAAALLWGPVCATPWVLAIHVGAKSRLPGDAAEWGGIVLRALILGVAAVLVTWRVLRQADAGRRRSGATPSPTAAGAETVLRPGPRGRHWSRSDGRRHDPSYRGDDVPG